MAYSALLGSLRCKTSCAILRSAVMCIRGSRSSIHHAIRDSDIALACSDGGRSNRRFSTEATGGIEDRRVSGQNFEEGFDPIEYHKRYFPEEIYDSKKLILKTLHELYSSYGPSPSGLKVLDYGCGPIVSYEISAALQASEIVMADLTKKNREEVRLWVDKKLKPTAIRIDWSPFFKYVVGTLEGKSEQEAVAREDELRKRIKAVVWCDITADPPIEPVYEGPYDVVLCSLAIGCAYSSVADYETGVAKLAKLVKPGGKLCLYENVGTCTETIFFTAGEKFYSLSFPQDVLTGIVEKMGFQINEVKVLPNEDIKDHCDSKGLILILATKN